MKEFREIVNQIHYPETVNQSLRATIFDWFQFREVCDDEKFETFFLRVINRDLARYQQLLRIEPGITNYDWLVQTYRERQNVVSFSGYKHSDVVSEGEQVKSDSLNSSNIRTFANTDTKTGTKEADERSTDDTDTTTRYGKVDTKSGGISKSGTEGQTTTYGKVNTHSGGVTTTNSETKGTQYGKKNTHSGGISETGSDTESGSIGVTGTDSSTKDTKTLAKQSPQSISYSAGGGGAQSGIPSNLDWSYPGSQGEVGESESGSNSSTTTYNAHKHDITRSTTDTTATQLSGTDTTTISGTKGTTDTTKSTLSGQDGVNKTFSETNTDNRVDTLSGSDKIEIDGERTRHYEDERRDIVAHTGTITDGKTGSGESEVQTQNGITSQHQDDHMSIDQTVYSGRELDPATLMESAKAFIKSTNAWSWFANQLEVCFMGIY